MVLFLSSIGCVLNHRCVWPTFDCGEAGDRLVTVTPHPLRADESALLTAHLPVRCPANQPDSIPLCNSLGYQGGAALISHPMQPVLCYVFLWAALLHLRSSGQPYAGKPLLLCGTAAFDCDHGFSFRSSSAKKIRQSRHLCFRGRSFLTVVRLLEPHSGQCLPISVNHLRTSTFVCLLV